MANVFVSLLKHTFYHHRHLSRVKSLHMQTLLLPIKKELICRAVFVKLFSPCPSLENIRLFVYQVKIHQRNLTPCSNRQFTQEAGLFLIRRLLFDYCSLLNRTGSWTRANWVEEGYSWPALLFLIFAVIAVFFELFIFPYYLINLSLLSYYLTVTFWFITNHGRQRATCLNVTTS